MQQSEKRKVKRNFRPRAMSILDNDNSIDQTVTADEMTINS